VARRALRPAWHRVHCGSPGRLHVTAARVAHH
jgi:hypothetical protein